MNPNISTLYNAILDGDVEQARGGVQSALEAGLGPGEILSEGMIAAMEEVGRRFEEGEYYVPEMLISARAMQAALSLLKPHLISSDIKSAGKIAIGTVKGDLHDIGKNLVGLMLEGVGFEVMDLGVDVPSAKFIEAISANGANMVAFSALLTTTMLEMKKNIDAIKLAGLREKVKIIVGGAPITEEFASQIGADGFAADASRAVSLAKTLMG